MACFYHAPGKEDIRQNFWMTLTPQSQKLEGWGYRAVKIAQS